MPPKILQQGRQISINFNRMLWFLIGIVIVVLCAYILFGVLQLVLGILGWMMQLILRLFGMDSD